MIKRLFNRVFKPYLHLFNYVNIFTSFFDQYIEYFIHLELDTERSSIK